MGNRVFAVYILTNERHTVLYTGVTGDLKKRVWEHAEKTKPGFTQRYDVTKLVYYEVTEDARAAIVREKQIKAGSRAKKVKLITAANPRWADLAGDL